MTDDEWMNALLQLVHKSLIGLYRGYIYILKCNSHAYIVVKAYEGMIKRARVYIRNKNNINNIIMQCTHEQIYTSAYMHALCTLYCHCIQFNLECNHRRMHDMCCWHKCCK